MSTGSRDLGLTLTTDNGTQFTSARFVEVLSRSRLTDRHAVFNHPEGSGLIERFKRSVEEQEV